jgi:hypothetical protein
MPTVRAALAALLLPLVLAVPAAQAADPPSGDHLVVTSIPSVASTQAVSLLRVDGAGTADGPAWVLPTAASGSDKPFTLQGDSNAVGGVNRSADGRYVTLAGYTTATGGSASASDARVVARVGANGIADTSTTLGTAYTTQNIRGAATADGSAFYVAGNGNTSAPLGGNIYSALGGTSPTVISSRTVPATSSNAAFNNTRTATVVDGDVWWSSEKGTAGVYRTTGLPTTGQTPTTVLTFGADGTGVISILALRHDGTATAADTLYVVQETVGIFKFSRSGSTWTNRGSVATGAFAAVTGKVDENGRFRLYATRGTGAGNSLVTLTDSAAFDAAPSVGSTETTLATAPSGTVYRGVAFAPADAALADAPTAVSGTPGDGSVALTWTAPATDGGSAITGYRVTPYVNGVAQTPILTGTTTTSRTVTGLTNGVAYTFTVAAVTANGVGVASAPSAALTPQAPVPVPTIQLSDVALSGSRLDPTNPTVSVTVAQTGTAASGLTVAATASTSASVAPTSAVTVTGTGATRTVAIAPVGVGLTDITLTVTGTGGQSASTVLHYAASAPTSTPSTSRFLTGASDASAAIDVGDGYVLVGDDENNVLRLYAPGSGAPVKQWDVTSQIGNPEEVDIEASARVGNTVYWTGSMGNSKSGNLKPDRSTLFTTVLSGSGASTELTVQGYYRGLRADLIAWDQQNANRYGFASGAAQGKIPKRIDGFNVEGLEFAPGSTTTAYVGFRAPLAPATATGKAILVPVTNMDQLATAPAGTTHATFGTPIELDLGGLSVRDIRKNANGDYLILAGSWAAGGSYALYRWDGVAGHGATRLKTVLPADDGVGEDPGAWEAIVATPQPLVSGASIRLLMDNGSADFYNTGGEAKSLPYAAWRKARSDVFTITTGAALSFAVPAIPAQAANTIGPAQTITVTNSGDQPATVTKVKVREADAASADEFLLTAEDCTDAPLAAGATCTVRVRYAPGRANATTTASLVLTAAAVDGGSASATLTATSTELPKGDKGDTGDTGATGPKGDTGDTGAAGPKGDTGNTGAQGPKGDTGDAGATGPQGATGAQGSAGATGATGPQGATGATGAQGAAGATGATGATGSQGAKGDTGTAGAKGDKGDTGATGTNGTNGAKGDKGDKGDTGETGPQGPAGPVTVATATPTISVDKRGHLVVTVRNTTAKRVRARVQARATVNGKRVVLAAKTVTLGAKGNAKVALTVGAKARRQLGTKARPLTITVTPLTGTSRKTTTLKARVTVR